MNFEKMIVIIIILVVMIGGNLPRLYVNFRFVKSFIISIKETIQNLRKERELDNYEEIVERVKADRRYLIRQLLNLIRIHQKHILLTVLFLTIGIILLRQCFLRMPELKYPQMSESMLAAINLIAVFGYWLCKGDKRKWQYSLVLIVAELLQIIWKIFIMYSPFFIMDIMMVIFWMLIFINCYYKWKMKNEINFFELQKKMQESVEVNEKLQKQYQALLEQRHDNKKHFSILYHLNQEKEIIALQEYLAQLERERTMPRDTR